MHVCSKINLSLAVTGKRSDGYHTLETLFFPIHHISDELFFSLRVPDHGGIIIESDLPNVPCAPQKNLCGRAALAYFAYASMPLPDITISIKKRIPVAAGMGGGSSDAAHTLTYLQQQYKLLDDTTLRAIAVKLGADVPFFLNPVPSIGRGIGEELTPVNDLPETLPIRIFAPQFPVSAAWAYKHTDILSKITVKPHTDRLISALQNQDYQLAANLMRNDLEDSLFRKFPILSILRKKILAFGALKVMISGSGPTLFALYPNMDAAQKTESLIPICREFKVRML